MTEAIKKSSHRKTLSPEELAAKEAAKIAKKVTRSEARNTPEAIEARKQRRLKRDKEAKARRQSNPKPRRILTPEELALKAQAKASKALKTKPTTVAQANKTSNRQRLTAPTKKLRVYYIKAYKYAGEVIEKSQRKAAVIDRSTELKALEAARQEARSNLEAFISGRVLDYRQANHFAKINN